MKHQIYTHILTFALIAMVLCITPVVVATPILDLERTSLQPQETLIGKLYTGGEFEESIAKEDITFFEGQKQVFFEYELYHYNGDYYFYAIFTREGTFTIKTKEILYSLAGEVGSKAITKTITVAYDEANTTEPSQLLSVEPGVVYTLGDTASIKLFNRGSSALDIDTGDNTFVIPAFQARVLHLNLEAPFDVVNIASYKTFSVPIIFLGAPIHETNDSNASTNITTSSIIPNPISVEQETTLNKTVFQEIELINFGETEITNIHLVENIGMAQITVPESIAPGESDILTLEIFSASGRDESITLRYTQDGTEFNMTIPIVITITTADDNDTPPVIDTNTCSATGGTLCEGECQGESDFTSDGYCCYAECVPFQVNPSEGSSDEESPSYGWAIGLFIFLILGIVGYIIVMKYRKKKQQTPEKKLDISKEKFENRMQGREQSGIHGAVTRH